MPTSTLLACPICESHRWDDYVVVARGSQPQGGIQDFAVLRCRQHGVEFADAYGGPPSIEALQHSLDAMYGPATGSHPRYVDFMDRVETVVGRPPGGVLHDVGCGNGHLVLEARRRGWWVQGNETAPTVRPEVERHGIACWIGTLSELNLAAEGCDVITSFCVLPHHLTDPTPDMRAAWRMLKPGGWLVAQLPSDGPFRRAAKLIYRLCWPWRPTRFSRYVISNVYGPGGHQFAYTRRNLSAYLQKCGFEQMRFAPYYPNSRCSLARFRTRPWWFRAAAWAAVASLIGAARVLRLPNHMVAYAQKPPTAPRGTSGHDDVS